MNDHFFQSSARNIALRSNPLWPESDIIADHFRHNGDVVKSLRSPPNLYDLVIL